MSAEDDLDALLDGALDDLDEQEEHNERERQAAAEELLKQEQNLAAGTTSVADRTNLKTFPKQRESSCIASLDSLLNTNNDDAEVWNDDQSTMAHHADTTDDGQRQATPLQCSVICIVLLIIFIN